MEKEDNTIQFFDEQEKTGKANTIKYFDRIHDKLFTFNNILIVGFFTISKIDSNVSIKYILFPITNLIILIFIEWYMMEISRTESNITKIPVSDFEKRLYGKYKKITHYSLLEIISTAIITGVFLYLILCKN
jgi:hypothetical protein